MSSKILINTVIGIMIAGGTGGPSTHFAGDTITDAGVQSAVTAAGGVLVDTTDTYAVAAAALVTKLRAGGNADEATSTRLMMAAYGASATAQAVAAAATANSANAEKIIHVVIDIPLATIQAQASGVAFDIGSALPANARLIVPAQTSVLTAITGGTISAATVATQKHGDATGSLTAAVTCFTGAAATNAKPGTNPYLVGWGAAQLAATLTSTGDTLANATAGHLQVDVLYAAVI